MLRFGCERVAIRLRKVVLLEAQGLILFGFEVLLSRSILLRSDRLPILWSEVA